jgi:beta-galactosidase
MAAKNLRDTRSILFSSIKQRSLEFKYLKKIKLLIKHIESKIKGSTTMKRIFLFFCFILISIIIANAFQLKTETHEREPRQSFDANWLFARYGLMQDGSIKAETTGLENPNIDDANWRKLDVPHDWGIEGPFRMDLQSTSGKLPWAGIGWYRKHFTVSQNDKGRCFYVDFDGAMSHAKVWLNGKYLGEWPYGYASFRLEMTPHIKFDGENVLAVRLDNPPNSSRWYPGSGIYRNVWLVKTDSVHVAHWGVFVTTPNVSKEKSTIQIKTEIENQSSEPSDITITSYISELGKKDVVASMTLVKVSIPAGSTHSCKMDIDLPYPKLWDVENPNLYCVKTSLQQKNRIIETTETEIGIREARFTPDSGFILNGRRVRIQGVCNHHDFGLLGTALNEKALERQIRILKEMGCNAIRTSHNPPAPELLNLCDRMGILVLDEAFDCWKKGKMPNDYSTLFAKWHEKDIRALVKRDRNHPCIVAWSSGNEVWEQNDVKLSQYLRNIFLSEDSTRPVTVGCNGEDSGFNGFQNSLDVFGFNYKPYRYAQFKETSPLKPFMGTETASCVSTNGDYFFPVSDDKSKGFFNNQVSSYDLYAPPWAYAPDVEFEAQDRNPSIAGEFVWTGFDYLGEPTPFGDDTLPSRSSYFGIVDLCGFKKDRFYIYQARWQPDLPMAHILPHWNWPERGGLITPVHVYTSGDEAELFLNGQSLGRKKKEQYKYRLRWDDVKYAPGELKVIAYKGGKKWAEDIVRTTSQPIQVKLIAESTVMQADGRDLMFITAKIVDKDGLMVPTAGNLVRFTINGPGVIAAVGNGDPTDHGSFQSDRCKAFHGQCLLILRSLNKQCGVIRVIAESEYLKSEGVEIIAN